MIVKDLTSFLQTIIWCMQGNVNAIIRLLFASRTIDKKFDSFAVLLSCFICKEIAVRVKKALRKNPFFHPELTEKYSTDCSSPQALTPTVTKAS